MAQELRPVAELALDVNARSADYEIGALQQHRRRIKGLRQARDQIFATPSDTDWVAHYGGRKEPQFNIAYETLSDGRIIFRHGVAFSLEPSRSVPDLGVLIAKIPRFNDYLREHVDDLSDFQMWHWHPGSGRSPNHAVGEILSKLAVLRTFIFLGRSCDPQDVDVDQILRDFDRLLPLYLFTEAGETESTSVVMALGGGPVAFVAREPPNSTWATASQEARQIDISLRHTAIQRALYDRLVSEFGKDCVGSENLCAAGGRIDLVVKTATVLQIYEIKTASTARGCIREALGQLIDYAFWPNPPFATGLYVAGEPPMTPDVERYLERLNGSLPVRLEYVQVTPVD